MPESLPSPISRQEKRLRLRQIRRTAAELGFEGKVEYRHVQSGTGGAQYAMGSTKQQDRLVVFVEAFERAADPADFSLEAILAHEHGHQLVVRHPKLVSFWRKGVSLVSEEILASLIGSLIARRESDREALYCKALYDATACGVEADRAVPLLHDLRVLLEKAL